MKTLKDKVKTTISNRNGSVDIKSMIPIIIVIVVVAIILCLFVLLGKKDESTEKTPTETQIETLNPTDDSHGIKGPLDENGDYLAEDGLALDKGMYENKDTVSVDIEYEGELVTYTFGAQSFSKNTLILNPKASIATPENKVGFYFRSDEGMTGTCKLGASPESELIVNAANCIIPEQTYDSVCDAEYRSMTDYGARWNSIDGVIESTIIHVRAVDLSNNRMLAIIQLVVEKENGIYKLKEAVDGNLPQDAIQRDSIEAFVNEIMRNTSVFNFAPERYNNKVLIEKLEKITYFLGLSSVSGDTVLGAANLQYPLYAVTLNMNNLALGYITLYCYAIPIEGGGESTSYILSGYDFLLPQSTSTIIKPHN